MKFMQLNALPRRLGGVNKTLSE